MITSLRDKVSCTPRCRFSRGMARGGMACAGHWRPRALLRADLAGVWLSVFASVTAAAGGEVERPAGVCGYELTVAVLDPCCGCFGSPNNWGRGVNALGHVVGRYSACDDTTEYAFLWTGGSEIITLDLPWEGSSGAFDINDAGQIVGTVWASGLGRRAFLFDGKESQLIPVPPGGTYTEATAINESGQVTGSWGNHITGDPTGEEAFLWEDGVMTPLGPILGTPKSSGDDINDHGWVTGWMGPGVTAPRAFIWDGATVTELPVPEGTLGSTGLAINNRGDVAGWIWFHSETGESFLNAALWSNGSFFDLGRLPGHVYCRARGINDRGEIVGSCATPGLPTRAFFWRNGRMFELDSLVKGELELQLAWAISESGAVTGTTSVSDTFLAVPVNAPRADLTADCIVDPDDLLVLLEQWGGPGAADFDGDGIVGLSDLLLLLRDWS